MDGTKKVELVFPETDFSIENKPIRRGLDGKMLQKFVANIDDIATWFNKYEIQSIELWISGAIETNGVLKLAVSAKGEGGLKVVLKPKKDTQETSQFLNGIKKLKNPLKINLNIIHTFLEF